MNGWPNSSVTNLHLCPQGVLRLVMIYFHHWRLTEPHLPASFGPLAGATPIIWHSAVDPHVDQAVGEKDVLKDQGNVMGNHDGWVEVRQAVKGPEHARQRTGWRQPKECQVHRGSKETPLTETQSISQRKQLERQQQPHLCIKPAKNFSIYCFIWSLQQRNYNDSHFIDDAAEV